MKIKYISFSLLMAFAFLLVGISFNNNIIFAVSTEKLDFSESGLTNISLINESDLSQTKYINLSKNSLSNVDVENILTLLNDHPSIEAIYLNDNDIDLDSLDETVLNNNKLIWGFQNVDVKSVYANEEMIIDYFYNANTSTFAEIVVNDEIMQNTSQKTTYTFSTYGKYNVKFVNKIFTEDVFSLDFNIVKKTAPILKFENSSIYTTQKTEGNQTFLLSTYFIEKDGEFDPQILVTDNTLPVKTYDIFYGAVPSNATNTLSVLGYKKTANGFFMPMNSIFDIDTKILDSSYRIKYIYNDDDGNASNQLTLDVVVKGTALTETDFEDKALWTALYSANISEIKTQNTNNTIFASDYEKLKELKLNGSNIKSLKGIEKISFSNLTFLNLTYNNLNIDAMPYLETIAVANPNAKIIVFFNNILGAESYASNIFLGLQNVRDYYFNLTPDSCYTLYNDYVSGGFSYNVEFVSRLDNSILLSDGSTPTTLFPTSGTYKIKFEKSTESYIFSLTYAYAYLFDSEKVIDIEFGSTTIPTDNIRLSLGLSIDKFVVRLEKDGVPFEQTKLEQIEVDFCLYKKTDTAFETRLISFPQNINIIDSTPPTITPTEQSLYVYINGSYTDLGATAEDKVDGECEVVSEGQVDTTKVGKYKITYTATDKSGNKGVYEKIVEVIYHPITTLKITNTSNQITKIGDKISINLLPICDFPNTIVGSPDEYLYYIYINNELIASQNNAVFEYQIKSYGVTNVKVCVYTTDDYGHTLSASAETNVYLLENYWWQPYTTELIFIIIATTIILGGIILQSTEGTGGNICKKITLNQFKKKK